MAYWILLYILFYNAYYKIEKCLCKLLLSPLSLESALYQISQLNTSFTPHEFNWEGDIWILGDLHGDWHNTVHLLQNASIIDQSLNWKGNNSLLIQVGDVLDRGSDGIQIYYLLLCLKQEAELVGGRVVLLLGNHEMLNICNNFDYVNEAELSHYSKSHRRSLFDNDGIMGRWLLHLPGVVKINELIISHAGLQPQFALKGIKILNNLLYEEIQSHCKLRSQIIIAQKNINSSQAYKTQIEKNFQSSSIEQKLEEFYQNSLLLKFDQQQSEKQKQDINLLQNYSHENDSVIQRNKEKFQNNIFKLSKDTNILKNISTADTSIENINESKHYISDMNLLKINSIESLNVENKLQLGKSDDQNKTQHPSNISDFNKCKINIFDDKIKQFLDIISPPVDLINDSQIINKSTSNNDIKVYKYNTDNVNKFYVEKQDSQYFTKVSDLSEKFNSYNTFRENENTGIGRITKSGLLLVTGGEGFLWTRFLEKHPYDEMCKNIHTSLSYFGNNHSMIVGHTVTRNHHVNSFCNNKFVMIDTGCSSHVGGKCTLWHIQKNTNFASEWEYTHSPNNKYNKYYKGNKKK